MAYGTCRACGTRPTASKRAARCNRCLTGVMHCACGRELHWADRFECRPCRDERSRTAAICANPACGKEFMALPKRGANKSVKRYCCRPCFYAAPTERAKKAKRPRLTFIERCQWCRKPKVARRPIERYVCDACSDRDYNLRTGKRLPYSDVAYATCRPCGGTYAFPAHQNPESCAKCRKRARRLKSKGRAPDPANVVTWRASLKDGPVPPGRLRRVAERDGWCCHLCGKKVPDRAYGARQDDATIDHLIPRSKGGSNRMENLALAHNRCNYRRRDEGIVQLRLIA